MKQILVLSGKGGTGKTTIASAFIRLLKAKAFADCDVDAPNLHLLMQQKDEEINTTFYGMKKAKINEEMCISCGMCKDKCRFDAILDSPTYHVDEFACEGCSLCEELCPQNAITMEEHVAGDLKLFKGEEIFSTAKLKMGSGNSGLLVSEVKNQLKTNAKDDGIAIIDGSPGIGCPVIASISGVDMVLIVAEPSISGVSDMERIIETARKFKSNILVCINKFDTNVEYSKVIEEICEKYKLPKPVKIPFDKEVVKIINSGKTIVDVDSISGHMVKKVFEQAIEIVKRL